MTRDNAIKEINNLRNDIGSAYDDADQSPMWYALGMAIEALQKRKTGKWIITARNGILCSECKSGTRKMPMLFGNPLYKFCPFCGVKMEVPVNENDIQYK